MTDNTDELMADPTPLEVQETIVLEKFEGEETVPEALVERIHIENGEIIKQEFFENGVLVDTQEVKEVT